MARRTSNVSLLVMVAVCMGIATNEAVADLTWFTWSASQGGNGHLYAVTESPSSWFDAEAIAVAEGGHLVTINNQAEQDWLNMTFPSGEPFHPWIGLWQDPNNPGYSEPGGGWVWVDGDPATYRNWASGEPNQSLGAPEDYAQMHAFGPGLWQDVPGNVSYALQPGIIEQVPTPTSALLGVVGLGLLTILRRR